MIQLMALFGTPSEIIVGVSMLPDSARRLRAIEREQERLNPNREGVPHRESLDPADGSPPFC